MRTSRDLAGTFADRDTPEWDPLIALVGEVLVGWFMWMYPLELEDGTLVHAYKHIFTRRYAFISEEGRTFAYTREGLYRPLAPRAAIEQAFECWDELTADADDRAEVRRELPKALRRAAPTAA